MIVEAKDVRFFKIEKIGTSESSIVKIEGLVFHSSMAVKKIEIKNENKTAVISVYLTPANNKLSGRFVVDVPLTNEINSIVFGESRTEIWTSAN